MGLAQRNAAIGVVFAPIEEAAPIQRIVERRGNSAGLVFIAESAEGIIVHTDLVIDTDIEVVAALAALRVGKEVVAVDAGIGSRK